MGNKLYVANLAFHLTETEISGIFSPIGTVQDVKLILDKITGKSRGFAFVTMSSDGEAERAISEMNGQKVEGRSLAITEARPREERPPGFRPPASGGGGFRPPSPGSSSAGGATPPSNRPAGNQFGQDRPPFNASKDRFNTRGGSSDPRREKEKPRGPRPIRDYEDDDAL